MDDGIDPANYDCDRLFPEGVTQYYKSGKTTGLSWEARRWLQVSKWATHLVGGLSKVWISCEAHH